MPLALRTTPIPMPLASHSTLKRRKIGVEYSLSLIVSKALYDGLYPLKASFLYAFG